MAKYNHTTLEGLRNRVAEKLRDNDMIFWTSANIDSFIEESLLTFGAISGFWKEEISIKTSIEKRMYDIFSADVFSDTKVAPTLSYQNVINWLNRDLIENLSTPNPTSEFFSLSELISIIEARYNLYQLLISLVINSEELNVPPEQNTIKFDDNVLDIVRLTFVYKDTYGDLHEVVLEREDEAELSYFNASVLTEQGVPEYFSTVYGSPNEIKLYPIPNIHGTLKLLSINGQDVTVERSPATLIRLPNNLVPYIKFGVEIDIFSGDGIVNDPVRVNYCKQRWEEGILIGRNYSSILTAKANGIYINIDSISNMDSFITPVVSSKPPSMLGLAGLNIFSVDTIPDAPVHSLDLLVIQNAKLPIDSADKIDVELDYIDIIADYAMHIAQFRCGAAYLAATNNAAEQFIKIAVEHNLKLQNRGISYENLIRATKKEEVENPRLVKESV